MRVRLSRNAPRCPWCTVPLWTALRCGGACLRWLLRPISPAS